MIFFFIILLVFSTQNSYDSAFKQIYLENDDTECTYNENITDNIISLTPICFINCTFNNLKTESDGGAITIKMKKEYDENVIFDECVFNNCQSQNGGAIFIEFAKKCIAEIMNSIFTNNHAMSYNGGSIYATSDGKCDLKLTNCTIESNYFSSAIFINNINFIFDNCSFKDNNFIQWESHAYNEPSNIRGINSQGFLESCIFDNNINCTITECLFSKNKHQPRSGTSCGSALYGVNSYLCFIKSNFSKNYLQAQNFLTSTDYFHGGAVTLTDTICSFDDCLFEYNYIQCEDYSTYGGALYFESTNGTFSNCKFENNYAYSQKATSYGGFAFFLKSSCTFRDCLFDHNCAKSESGKSLGGAIYFDESDGKFQNCSILNNNVTAHYIASGSSIYSEIRKQKTGPLLFENCTISNNLALSTYGFSNGGSFYIIKTKVDFTDVFFINNTAISNAKNVQGGAIFDYESNGIFENCTFLNNSAYTQLNVFIDFEPRSLGGALSLSKCSFTFNDCWFKDNIGAGYSTKYDSTSNGGAIYAIESSISIIKSDFLNNNLYNNGDKFEYDFTINGSACYFSQSTVSLSDCSFLNNSASLNASKISKYFAAKIYGGSVYSSQKTLVCEHCTFLNNFVTVKDKQESEFAGSVYLTNGKLDNCSFVDNAAYNGADIVYEQTQSSLIDVKNCIFIQNAFPNHPINSLIQIVATSEVANKTAVVFSRNKVFINLTIVLFDGEIEIGGENEGEKAKIRFEFDKNCMSPLNPQMFNSAKIEILRETGEDSISFELAFESQCDKHETPTISIIQTEPVKTTTVPTEIQTEPVKTITVPTEIQTEPVKTITVPTEIQTEPVKTKTESTMIQTDLVKTPSESNMILTEHVKTPTNSPVQTHAKETEQKKKRFDISLKQLIGIICGMISFLLILIIILIIFLVVKRTKKHDNQYEDFLFNSTDHESHDHEHETSVNDNDQSIATINPNEYFEIVI